MSMLPFKRILVPIDFSDPARKALSSAAEMAEHFSAKLFVLHVMEPVPTIHPSALADVGPGLTMDPLPALNVKKYQADLLESNSRKLKEVVETIVPKGVEHADNVEIGDAKSEILHFAKENDIDLIVISTHGLTGVERFLLGSVAEKVVRLSPVPVMIVRHSQTED